MNKKQKRKTLFDSKKSLIVLLRTLHYASYNPLASYIHSAFSGRLLGTLQHIVRAQTSPQICQAQVCLQMTGLLPCSLSSRSTLEQETAFFWTLEQESCHLLVRMVVWIGYRRAIYSNLQVQKIARHVVHNVPRTIHMSFLRAQIAKKHDHEPFLELNVAFRQVWSSIKAIKKLCRVSKTVLVLVFNWIGTEKWLVTPWKPSADLAFISMSLEFSVDRIALEVSQLTSE